ncbi:MAG: endonuclease [Tahibacter sp.]
MFVRTSGALAALCCILVANIAHADVGGGTVSFNGGATQDFNTLVSSGTGAAANMPTGWYFVTGNNATSYAADDGSMNIVGNVYSYGSTGNAERAFGSLLTNTVGSARIGAKILNQSGSTLSQLQVSYTGEVWQYQATNADKLTFEYSTDATSLTTGTWTSVTGLDFNVPGTVVGTGKKDGNLAANRAAVSFNLSGITVADGSVLWVRWSDANVGGVDNGLAIDDVLFGTPVDTPPAVASTTPANNATNVATTANITVNFNEAVTLDPSWYTLSCTSGSHSATVSGGPTSYTLNPDVDFVYDDVCTLTVLAAAVTDQDAPPDHPGANTVVNFTVASAPVDNPPAVQTTSPANNATNVGLAANFTITFSEPVTLDAGWYGLSCATSGVHTAVQGGSGASFTLNPDVDFTALETCDLTLLADHIHDQDGTIQQMVSNFLLHFTAGATAGDYYAGICTHTATGSELKAALHDLIKNHTAVSYSGTAPNVLTVMNLGDEDPLNPSNILDVYKNHSCPKQLSGATCYNKEHTWPNSHGFNDVVTVNMNPYSPYSDTHMLYASDVNYNSHRGNLPYGNCTSGCSVDATEIYFGFGGSGHDNKFDSNVYEVWDHRKGDTARAVLYMDVRYKGGTNNYGQQEPDLQVTDNLALIVTTPSGVVQSNGYMGKKSDLIAWSNGDAPDNYERLRNDAVYSFQQNRNPFIDHPEWVDCVFNNTNCPTPCTDVIFKHGFE